MRIKTLASIVLTALVGTTLLAGQSGAPQVAPRSTRNSVPYGQLPLTFEANRGQTAGQVKFLSRGKGYTAFLTTGGMVLSLRPSHVVKTTGKSSTVSASQASSTTLQFRLVGASKNPAVVGEDIQPGRINYFLGNDRSRWHTNLPTYAKVRYKNVYPGIDLVYYGNHQQLEYDFAISPGADASQVQFEIQGARQIRTDSAGDLVLETANGTLHFQTPVVYQESKGMRTPVRGSYVVHDSSRVTFRVDHYDSSKQLVIDPVLVYSTYLGGSGSDQPVRIGVDDTGSVYIAGSTDSADFPLAALGSLPTGTDHVFVAKLDPTGSNLVYADYIGGNSQDFGYALAIDSNKEVYLTGSTASSDFPMVNPYQGSYPGSFNAFLTKISADGSTLQYSTYLGGNGSDVPAGLAIDNLGSVVVAGNTSSTNFPAVNAYQTSVSANQGGVYGNYGFLTKFSPDGSSLVYSTYLGGNTNVPYNCGGTPCWGSPYSAITGVVVDTTGNAYTAGATNTYNFPTTAGAYQGVDSTQQNSPVGFVSKFDGSGNLAYSTYFYESSGTITNINAIAVDGSGSAYLTGVALSDGTFPITTTSICDPGVDGFGCNFGFVAKFDAAGANLVYSTFLGPNNGAIPQAIALDANNNAYILASTTSSSFTTVNGIESYTNESDLLLVEIDPIASTQMFATYLGATGNESPAGLALDSTGNIYLAGVTSSTDFPTTQGAYQRVLGGGDNDAFLMKIGAASAPSVSFSPGSLQFSALTIGSASQPQLALLRNMGSAPLSIASITAVGDFSETDTCGGSVPAAGSCTFSVTFTPTALGSRGGSIVIQDDASGSSHSLTLQGIGSGPSVALTPTNLTFPSVSIGTSSTPQTVTLTSTGDASLSISSVQVSGAYTQTNNCPATLPSGSSCTINVTFTPTSSGTLSGTLTVNDNVQGGTQTVNLTGTGKSSGTGSGSDFALSTSTSSVTIKAGATATYTLTVSPVGGSFSNAVSLACSGLPANASCSFSPSTVTPGTKSTPVTLNIATKAVSADLVSALPTLPHHRPMSAVWIQLQGFGLFGMVVAGCAKRSKRLTIYILLALLVLGMIFMSGCAGGTGIAQQQTGSGTTYTVTVTGTSGALQHSLPVSLTIE